MGVDKIIALHADYGSGGSSVLEQDGVERHNGSSSTRRKTVTR